MRSHPREHVLLNYSRVTVSREHEGGGGGGGGGGCPLLKLCAWPYQICPRAERRAKRNSNWRDIENARVTIYKYAICDIYCTSRAPSLKTRLWAFAVF